MKKHILFLLAAMSAALFSSCTEKQETNPVPSDKWLLISPSSASLYVGDEYVISPTFDSEETKALDFEWTVSDPSVLSIVEDNNSSITVGGLKPGNATVKVECPGETKRLSRTVSFTVLEVPPAEPEPLRILAIGNSFSQDAVEQYLWNLFDEAGTEVIIGNMYIGGCSLERHWTNAQNNSKSYEYRKVVNGNKTNTKNWSLEMALADENWDYISLQQASDYSGMYDKYEPYLGNLIDYVLEHSSNPRMQLMFHQTWAYAQNSDHQAFPNYDNDQMKMYEGIVDASRQAMDNHPEIKLLIPSGTTIQNGRTTSIGDKWNRDGYHLNTDYGRFAAACTWYETISGNSVLENAWKPSGVTDGQAKIARNAAHYAVEKPFEVTDMSDY